ncbi:MAG TPA: hypothetical protein PL124_11375 [Candidatus Cloacimonadota bacterium]|nr:hypothetical protein [Candidatus Cloacimonadota bacterium]
MKNCIFVVGTCHGDTTGFKVDHLYNLLCEIKPDLILDESPIDNNIGIMDWLKACANYYKKRGGGEAAAVLKYLADHQATVLPYDIKGRNDYFIKMKFFEKEQAYNEACNIYFKQTTADPTAAYLYKLMGGMAGKFGFHETKDKRSIYEINSPLCDTLVETYISFIRQVNKALFALVPEFSRYEKDFWQSLNFHARRDQAMVTNILNYNMQYENRTIVVLCGYFHRYAIIKGLIGRQEKDDFKLITDLGIK